MRKIQLSKIRVGIRRLSRKSDELMIETRWYPLVVASALIVSIAVAVRNLS